MAKSKARADVLLVQQGLAENRSQARRLILAGQVWAGDQRVEKPGTLLPVETSLRVQQGPRFVSRGGEKLAAALEAFPVPVQGAVAADVGASTGGFTDCLLQHGAARVYAIDVGHGQLHWKLRQDPRVVVMEGVNARHLERLPEPISLLTADVSFISLTKLLPGFTRWFGPEGGHAVVLIKPQFEAGRREAARGKGVIRDPQVWARVLREVLDVAHQQGFGVHGLLPSPVLGPKGNVEFLAYLRYPDSRTLTDAELQRAVAAASALRARPGGR
ncbi:MAG: TlyA family RNA methyltransferase [Chloroflexi bacterium]|nr:TlyA family RNA methyltransferase [Chloroflexota bacterium]